VLVEIFVSQVVELDDTLLEQDVSSQEDVATGAGSMLDDTLLEHDVNSQEDVATGAGSMLDDTLLEHHVNSQEDVATGAGSLLDNTLLEHDVNSQEDVATGAGSMLDDTLLEHDVSSQEDVATGAGSMLDDTLLEHHVNSQEDVATGVGSMLDDTLLEQDVSSQEDVATGAGSTTEKPVVDYAAALGDSQVVSAASCGVADEPMQSSVSSGTVNISCRRNPSRNKRRQFSDQWSVPSLSKVYCICRKSWKGEAMIQCDSCDSWYHCNCLQIDVMLCVTNLLAKMCSLCVARMDVIVGIGC